MSTFDPVKAAIELKWLQANPEFEERPATIREFLSEGYLDIDKLVRPGIKEALIKIFGDDVQSFNIASVTDAMITGAIGIGKTTFASIALPYMVHWVLCLRDPQAFFDLLPGSRIAFMQMSTSEDQAKEVIFGDIKARIEHSKWFIENHPMDPKFTNQIRFDKDIWILPGDSAETTFEGYNILGGILDEADSHKVTKTKDYAESGWNTIHARIESRFGNRGLLIVIGQMKKGTGFAAKKYREFKNDTNALVVRMTIWESYGWDKYLKPDGTRDSFWYNIKRKMIIPEVAAKAIGKSDDIIEIPNTYIKGFQTKPEQALRDLAGIPPAVGDPFISLTDLITEARDRWLAHHEGFTSPVDTGVSRPRFEKWFRSEKPLKRVVHLDIAYSAKGDSAAIAMGHVSEVVEIDDEKKPYIVIDCLYRVHAAPGTEIMISDLRRAIYELKEDRKFRIKKVTMDGFQSTDTRQQLVKKHYEVDQLSVDKSKLPYEDLREALYERRIEFPKYMTYIKPGDTEQVEILVRELEQLTDTGLKIDHPPDGSKDVADAVAGVVTTLMGDRQYRRGVVSGVNLGQAHQNTGYGSLAPVPPRLEQINHPALRGGLTGLISAPIPPRLPKSSWAPWER